MNATGAQDPWWVNVETDTIDVIMTETQAVAYQRWLRSNNLHLFQIPQTHVYAVGVRHMEGDGEVR